MKKFKIKPTIRARFDVAFFECYSPLASIVEKSEMQNFTNLLCSMYDNLCTIYEAENGGLSCPRK